MQIGFILLLRKGHHDIRASNYTFLNLFKSAELFIFLGHFRQTQET